MIKLKRLFSVIKAAVLIAAFSWLTSFCIMSVCWLFRVKESYLNEYMRIMIYAFIACAFVYTALFLIYLLVKNSKQKRLMLIQNEKGYCDEYYDLLVKLYKKGRRYKTTFKNALLYNDELLDGERFKEANDILKSIDTDLISPDDKICLCAAYLKTAAMSRDIQSAKVYYIILNEISYIADDRKGSGTCVAYSKALYLFVVEDYDEAVKQFEKAIELSVNKKLRTDARLMLSLSLLKAGHKEIAKNVAIKVCKEVVTKRQRENLLSLMTLIEREYEI